MSEETIFETVREIFPELLQYLQSNHPELVILYQQRYEYAIDEHYPPAMRMHNAYEILKTYMIIKLQKR
jgi:hypothetical protein